MSNDTSLTAAETMCLLGENLRAPIVAIRCYIVMASSLVLLVISAYYIAFIPTSRERIDFNMNTMGRRTVTWIILRVHCPKLRELKI